MMTVGGVGGRNIANAGAVSAAFVTDHGGGRVAARQQVARAHHACPPTARNKGSEDNVWLVTLGLVDLGLW